MKSLLRKIILPALIGMSASGVAHAQRPDCDKEPAACIRRAAAETAAFIDECGKAFPDSKAGFDDALERWSLRKLQIPGIEDAIQPGSQERLTLGRKAAVYMRSVGAYQREIECSSRYAMLRSKEPQLRADFVNLPPDPLERYLK